ncbi:MAG: VOC family protein [Micromonosporaceae bacterium]|nr:VOC family protein [Micromonosporaceae bacterium]
MVQMAKRSGYAPGVFSWSELATPDPADAKRFYGELFGWEFQDDPIPGDGVYTMARVAGDDVAGIMQQPEQQRTAGVPPNWFCYITVGTADEAASRAAALGGAVHAGPFDVMDSGRMAVIADPTGAMFGAWEPRAHLGSGRVNEPGTLTWNELATGDVPAATRFYQDLFGWTVTEIDTGGGPRYWTIAHDGAAAGRNGGVRELPPEQAPGGVPPHWLPYFAVESVAASQTTAGRLGGQTLVPPIQVPSGTFAVLSDPQGAALAIYEGEFDG